jgi:hypothetical protein
MLLKWHIDQFRCFLANVLVFAIADNANDGDAVSVADTDVAAEGVLATEVPPDECLINDGYFLSCGLFVFGIR